MFHSAFTVCGFRPVAQSWIQDNARTIPATWPPVHFSGPPAPAFHRRGKGCAASIRGRHTTRRHSDNGARLCPAGLEPVSYTHLDVYKRQVEEDATHFHIDPALLQELSRDSDQWAALMDQHAKENQVLAESDNSMIHRTITGDGTSLTLTFQFLHPVETPSVFTISLYGYRFDTSFGEMPKIEIESRREQILAVRNLKEKLPKSTVQLIPADDDQISVSIPFEALGNPQKICFGARLTCESLPVDWVSWRLIDLESHEEELPPPEEEIPADALEPVSYTHLDVYKRQPIRIMQSACWKYWRTKKV